MVRHAGPALSSSRRWLVAGTALALALVPVALSARQFGGVVLRGDDLLLEIGVWWGVSTLAVLCLVRAPVRSALLVAAGVGIVLRLLMIGPMPVLSDDYYRYAWDGRVQAAGIDPYRYAPLDAPRELRDDWLFPAAQVCAQLQRDLIERGRPVEGRCTLLNRPAAPTIYPPVAQGWFALLHLTGLTSLREAGLQTAGLVVDLAVLAALTVLLRRGGHDPRWMAAWALTPLPVLEAVADGHVDALAALLSLGAVALATRRHLTWAATVLALATLVKLYPALLLPALLAPVLRRPRRLRWPVGAFVAVCALGYLPHVLAVGGRVLGYLPGYVGEERYGDGSRYLLLSAVGLTGTAATVVAAGMLAAVGLLVAVRRPPPALGATWLYGALLLLVTPVQPWYALGLGAVALAAARPEWLAIGAAAYPLYVFTVLDRDAPPVGQIAYAAAGLVVLGVSLGRARGRWRTAPPPARSSSEPPAPAPAQPAATTR